MHYIHEKTKGRERHGWVFSAFHQIKLKMWLHKAFKYVIITDIKLLTRFILRKERPDKHASANY